ncbi:MAG: 16S rRNA (adenine(1518)-N(6)/adenine(1519)-N(6))-dimethyltransferase [Candidatus Portnoybacteria bacterium]|nr:16S rRNA (adenine(1518)-N(6)/adenine(1519)-N(6))-dimethyltransferase [Candidatus Portnoybacteria bacterium]
MESKPRIQTILHQYRLRPSKKLGQNFLIDRKVLYKIIGASDLSKNDTVVEVGPGLGILTIELARRVKKVIAVEKDARMIVALKENLTENKIENVEIIQGDILKLIPNDQIRIQKKYPTTNSQKLDIETWDFFCPPASLCPPPRLPLGCRAGEALRAGNSGLEILPRAKSRGGHYKVIANIPYYLTSLLIRNFLEANIPPELMVLMIQKEVAQRICASPTKVFAGQKFRRARPPHMSLLSVAVQFYAKPEIISYVSKKSFWPQPKVDSAIIKMTPFRCHPELVSGSPGPKKILKQVQNDKEFEDKFFKVVRAGFLHPRKQLANNLSTGLKIDRRKIEKLLEKIQLKSTQRAEELTVDNWRVLTVLIVENVV